MIDKYVGTSFVIMPQHEGTKVVYVIEDINNRHEFVISSDGRFVANYPVELIQYRDWETDEIS